MECEEKVNNFSGLSWHIICQKEAEKANILEMGGECQILLMKSGMGWKLH